MGWGSGNLGGSGGGLNLHIKMATGEKPVAGRQNDLWVETGAKMSSYILSGEKPVRPSEGMLWIQLLVADNHLLNLLRKNQLIAGLKNVMIYSKGKWEPLNAWIFDKGEWIQISWSWHGELFSPGNQWEEFTGGWTNETNTSASWTPGTMNIDENGYLDMEAVVHGAVQVDTGGPNKKKIDFTGYSKIDFEVEFIAKKQSGGVYFALVNDMAKDRGEWTPGKLAGTRPPALAEFTKIELADVQKPDMKVSLPITDPAPYHVEIALAADWHIKLKKATMIK